MMHLIAEDDPGLVILPLHGWSVGLARRMRGARRRLGDDFDVAIREVKTPECWTPR